MALLRRLRPQVVVSVGGYASVPAGPGGQGRCGIPIVVVSYDAVPGAAARLGSRLATRERRGLRRRRRCPRQVVTGAPLRARDPGRRPWPATGPRPGPSSGLPRRPLHVARGRRVARLGQAQRRGRELRRPPTPGTAATWPSATSSGSRHDGRRACREAPPLHRERPDGLWYQVVRYEDRMHLAYAAADLVLARAGATTVAELAALGVPVDPRAVAAGHRGPPDGQRPGARRRRRRRAGARGRARRRAPGPRGRPAGRRSRGARWPMAARARVGRPPRRRRPHRRAWSRTLAAQAAEASAGSRELSPRPGRGAPLDLTVPGRYHVVGVGGPGMRAIALVLAEMGHHVSGSDLRESPALDRLRAAGVTVHVGHDAGHVDGVDAVTGVHGHPRRATSSSSRPRPAGIPVLRRAGMLASICACARSVAVAGTHGKTTTTSMLAMMLVEAGLRPSFVVGGDVNDVGTGAHWSGGEWLVVEADESDGTFLELPALGHDPHQRRGRPPRPLRHVRGHRRRLRPLPRPGAGAEGGVRRRPRRRRAGRAARRHHLRHVADGADFRAGRRRGRPRARSRSRSSATARRLGRVHLPLRGVHNVRNATGAIAMALACGAPFDGRAPAPGPLRRRGPAVRLPGRARGHHPRRRLRPPARRRSPPCSTRAAHGGDGWQRVVAVFQPNRYSRMAVLSPEYRDAFVDADLAVITDIYPSGEAPRPGRHRRARGGRRAERPIPTRPSSTCRGGPTSSSSWPSELRRRRRVRLDGVRRRGVAAVGGAGPPRRAGGASASAGRPGRGPPIDRGGGRARGGRGRPRHGPERDVPLGPLHHVPRRRAGRAVRRGRVASTTSGSWPAPCRRAACRVLVVGRGLEPARRRPRASRAWSSRWAPSPRTSTIDGTARRGRAARCCCRCWPARRPPPGSPALEWAVGVPGSVGGAVRMNAGGHGSDMAAVPGGGPRPGPRHGGG